MRFKVCVLAAVLLCVLPASAGELSEKEVASHECTLSTLREARDEIDHRLILRVNRLKAEQAYWRTVADWAVEVHRLARSANTTELQVLEARLAAAPSLTADGKVFMPSQGLTTRAELVKALEQGKKLIAQVDQQFKASERAVHVPGVGNVRLTELEKRVVGLRNDVSAIRKAKNEGRLTIAYARLGRVSGRNIDARMDVENRTMKRIREQAKAGRYVFHSPHFGNMGRYSADDWIATAQRELTALKKGYEEGTMAVHRGLYGTVSRRNIEAKTEEALTTIKRLEKQLAEGGLTVDFGTGLFGARNAAAQITAAKAAMARLKTARDTGAYTVPTRYGIMRLDQIQQALQTKRFRGNNISGPQIGILRNARSRLVRTYNFDLEKYKDDLALWTAWRDAIPDAVKYQLAYLRMQVARLRAFRGEFSRVYADRKFDIERRIARIERSLRPLEIKQIILDPYTDRLAAAKRARDDIEHLSRLVTEHLKAFKDLKEKVGTATQAIIRKSHERELQRRLAFWSRAKATVQTTKIDGSDQAFLPGVGSGPVATLYANCTEQVRKIQAELKVVRQGKAKHRVMGLGTMDAADLRDSIREDERALAAHLASVQAGEYEVRRAPPFERSSLKRLGEIVKETKQIIAEKTRQMDQGEYPLRLPVVGLITENALRERLESEKEKLDAFEDGLKTGKVRIGRGDWSFSRTDLEEAVSKAEDAITEVDRMLAAGTLEGSFDRRLTGEQIDAELKRLEEREASIKTSLADKTYRVQMPQDSRWLTLEEIQAKLADASLSPPVREYHEQAQAFCNAASALEIKTIAIERRQFEAWKAKLVEQAKYYKARHEMDLRYYRGLKKEFGRERSHADANWKRRRAWYRDCLRLFP